MPKAHAVSSGPKDLSSTHNGPYSHEANLETRIGLSPYPGNPRHPVLTMDRLAATRKFLRRKNARCRGEFRPSHAAANCAGRHRHLRIIPNAFRFTHVTACHYVELAPFVSEPDWGRDADSIFPKCLQGNVILIRDGGGNLARHECYLIHF